MKKFIPYKIIFCLLPISVIFLSFSIISLYGVFTNIQSAKNFEIIKYLIITLLSFYIFISTLKIMLFTNIHIKDSALFISQIGILPLTGEWAPPGYHFSLKRVIDEIELKSIISLNYYTNKTLNKSKLLIALLKPIYIENENGKKIILETSPYSKKQINSLILEIDSNFSTKNYNA